MRSYRFNKASIATDQLSAITDTGMSGQSIDKGLDVFNLLTRNWMQLFVGQNSTREQHRHALCVISLVTKPTREKYLHQLQYFSGKIQNRHIGRLLQLLPSLTSLNLQGGLCEVAVGCEVKESRLINVANKGIGKRVVKPEVDAEDNCPRKM